MIIAAIMPMITSTTTSSVSVKADSDALRGSFIASFQCPHWALLRRPRHRLLATIDRSSRCDGCLDCGIDRDDPTDRLAASLYKVRAISAPRPSALPPAP